jgi:hypothetical protein
MLPIVTSVNARGIDRCWISAMIKPGPAAAYPMLIRRISNAYPQDIQWSSARCPQAATHKFLTIYDNLPSNPRGTSLLHLPNPGGGGARTSPTAVHRFVPGISTAMRTTEPSRRRDLPRTRTLRRLQAQIRPWHQGHAPLRKRHGSRQAHDLKTASCRLGFAKLRSASKPGSRCHPKNRRTCSRNFAVVNGFSIDPSVNWPRNACVFSVNAPPVMNMIFPA